VDRLYVTSKQTPIFLSITLFLSIAISQFQFQTLRKPILDLPSSLYSSIMSNRAIPAIGVAAAAAAGYYLYSAGGDPKLAEKKAECMRTPPYIIVHQTDWL